VAARAVRENVIVVEAVRVGLESLSGEKNKL
jgi:hypothetical protein